MDTKHFGTRILTFTLSMLTLLLWIYYNNDITAEMTSGPSGIPVNTFDDVIHYNYKVVTWSTYLIDLLRGSEEGTGCCFRDQSSKDPMGGWCAFYIPVQDSKGNRAGIDSFRTYRLSDEDFDAFEQAYAGKGSSYEEAIADKMLPAE